MDIKIESKVPESAGGLRIDKYLADRFTYFSRTKWQREITAGRISINGRMISNGHLVIRGGDIILYRGSSRDEPEVDTSFSILFEDETIIAVNKSGNLPVHPSGRFFNNTLLIQLQNERQEKLYPVHRIDRETSGIILFSRDNRLISKIQDSIKAGGKKYLSIVLGEPGDDLFTVDAPLGVAQKSQIRKKREAYTGAPEEAITHFRCLYRFHPYSLMEARLVTGRLHQIRAHLESENLPIIGDKMYGVDEMCYLDFISGKTDGIEERLHFTRSALHAYNLRFLHPLTGVKMDISAPLPEDMKLFLAKHGVPPDII